MMPAVGSPAPPFALPAADGQTIALADYHGRRNVVLYFYPKDMTPGCTWEACAFRDDLPQFAAAETIVLGVSADGVRQHALFTQKRRLTFPLLADEDHRVCLAYGVWQERSLLGLRLAGVRRATFLIDKQGVIRRVWPKVNVLGHAREVLRAAREL
jgi:peroxiredoxin Q/BCP